MPDRININRGAAPTYRSGSLRLHVVPHQRFSAEAVERVTDAINISQTLFGDGTSTIGFAPGTTMEKFLGKLAASHHIDWGHIKFIQTVEYALKPGETLSERPVEPRSVFSYHNYFKKHFFQPLQEAGQAIPSGNILDMWMMGITGDSTGKYLEKIIAMGGLDVLVLGLGTNGHILFNEPGSSSESTLRITDLTEETTRYCYPDNPFACLYPRAFTLGIRDILHAKHIFLLASGERKRDIISRLFQEEPSEALPASLIKGHMNVDVIADEEAASMLPISMTNLPDPRKSNEYYQVLSVLSRYDLGLDQHSTKHLAQQIAKQYLNSILKLDDLEQAVQEFAATDPPLPPDDIHFFIQNRMLDLYTNDNFLNDALNQGKIGNEDDEGAVRELYTRGFNVYRLPLTQDRIADRKKVLFRFLLFNIRPENTTIGSAKRGRIALDIMLNEVISSKDPSIYKPAVEAIVEIFIHDRSDYFKRMLDELLKEVEELPRFTEALVKLLERALLGITKRYYAKELGDEEFLNETKNVVMGLASGSLELCRELLGRLKVLKEINPGCAGMASEMRAQLHEIERTLMDEAGHSGG